MTIFGLTICALAAISSVSANKRVPKNEILSRSDQEKLGIVWRGNHTNSHEQLLHAEVYPDDFTWCNKDGVNYCTLNRNQHIPQYCGSCWAHGALSALGDRIKIARGAKGIDINLAVQHMLNCGNAGSCHGGSLDGPYQWIMSLSKQGAGISYETAQPYMACSKESEEGFCQKADWSCKPVNVARTCGSFDHEGGDCTGLSSYPNASVVDYGSISGASAMMKEIYHRGPITCLVDSHPLLNYEAGIIKEPSSDVNHAVSVVGWGTDSTDGKYWIVRNSWGEYWGDMGFVYLAFGALNIELQCAWAVPGEFTAPEKQNQVHCHEGGDNCQAKAYSEIVV